jgi:hypothetical protein
VLNLWQPDGLCQAVKGLQVGTLVAD